MKNIHIIPTDKPSRLISSGKEFNLLHKSTIDKRCKNIYITSDEEIKEGDWVVTPNKTIMLVTTKYTTESSFMIGNSKHKGSPYYIEFCKKIILTTDQDLINDGVQAIDDEFLEWFVKNPSCKWVEVKPILSNNGRAFYGYKIIIPQEEPKQTININRTELGIPKGKLTMLMGKNQEPKQEWTPTQGETVWIKVFSNWSKGTYIGYDVVKQTYLVREDEEGGGHLMSSSQVLPYYSMPNKPKQETLEEAAMNNIPTAEEFINIGLDESGFEFYGDMKKIASKKLIQFAKLHVEAALKAVQAERMYSEDKVIILLNKFGEKVYGNYTRNQTMEDFTEEWFEQHKKK
jgi:hypothetical protein